MATNRLADMLQAGRTVLGLGNMYPASGIIEGMCAGWDFVWIDAQHGQFSYADALHAVQAAGSVGIATIVRAPGHEYGVLGRYADLAPDAIMVPMVDNEQQARAIAHALRFAPQGRRSYGGRRPVDLYGRTYYRDAQLLVLAQIESAEGLANAEAIISTDGIDVLFFGPDDMKVEMGLPIDTPITGSDDLRRAMQRTAAASLAAGKHCGCVAPTAEAAAMACEMGYRIIVGGADIAFLRVGAAEKLRALRAVCEPHST
jgi:4-hydroxy-2-oxoheptanedioate aldolase